MITDSKLIGDSWLYAEIILSYGSPKNLNWCVFFVVVLPYTIENIGWSEKCMFSITKQNILKWEAWVLSKIDPRIPITLVASPFWQWNSGMKETFYWVQQAFLLRVFSPTIYHPTQPTFNPTGSPKILT